MSVDCRTEPSGQDLHHIACAPRPYWSSLMWDGADNTLFRPVSEALGLYLAGDEAVNVNSVDEVPDSSWFTNRIGARPMSVDEVARGACDSSLVLHPESAVDGSWIINRGKTEGVAYGFQVNVGGHQYLFKQDDPDQPELASAAQTIGLAIYHAAGFNTPCEQVVTFKPSLLKLTPGLRYKLGNLGVEKAFDRKALDGIIRRSPKVGDRIRMQASAWITGRSLGPFRYSETRKDDPNDVVAHQDRRELRASRLVAAWIDHIDAREGNSLDTWISDRKEAPDSSPGHVVHYLLDTSEALGPKWGGNSDAVVRRGGYGYVTFDLEAFGSDLGALGIPLHTWDYVEKTPGHEIYLYFNVRDFVPDQWKMAYPNSAFSRMTERDGAWMARILARFTPDMIAALARSAQFTNDGNTEYVTDMLEGRLERILQRYLTRLSPVTDVRIEGGESLCALDLAEWRALRDRRAFRYSARSSRTGPLAVERTGPGRICVRLPHIAPDGASADDSPTRYAIVTIADGVAQGTLVAHLYDLGPSRGYRLVGLQRPPH